MDFSSFGFARVCCRPAKSTKGMKKAAYCPKARCFPRYLARRLESTLFMPAASPYHEVLAVVQPDKAYAAGAEAYAARLSLLHTPPPPPPTPTSYTYLYLFRNCAQTCGWSGAEGREARSTQGSNEAGDGGMDKRRARPSIVHKS
jgi:hypothetical protein